MKKIKNLMIIDDDELNNYITGKIIEHAQLAEKVQCYISARKALAYLQANSYNQRGDYPEIILLDLSMYGMNGWEFLDQYEMINPEYTGKIHLFILASSIIEQERSKNYASVKDYFTKPLTMNNIEKIRGYINNKESHLLDRIKVLLNILF